MSNKATYQVERERDCWLSRSSASATSERTNKDVAKRIHDAVIV